MKDFSKVRLTLDSLSDLNFLNFIFNELNQDIGFTYKKLKNLLIKLRKSNHEFKENLYSNERNVGGEMSLGYKKWKYAETVIAEMEICFSQRDQIIFYLINGQHIILKQEVVVSGIWMVKDLMIFLQWVLGHHYLVILTA